MINEERTKALFEYFDRLIAADRDSYTCTREIGEVISEIRNELSIGVEKSQTQLELSMQHAIWDAFGITSNQLRYMTDGEIDALVEYISDKQKLESKSSGLITGQTASLHRGERILTHKQAKIYGDK